MGKVNKMIPSPERLEEYTDRLMKIKERVDKLAEKKIDPIYFEVAGSISPWLRESKAPWILERLFNIDMMRVCLALPDIHRDPSWGRWDHLEATEQFAKDLSLDKETIDNYLKQMDDANFIVATRKGYQMARISQTFHGFPGRGAKYFFTLPEDVQLDIQDLSLVFSRFELQPPRDEWIDWVKERGVGEQGREFAGFLIMPRWKSIKDLPGVLPVEDMRQILKAHEKFSALRCDCKTEDSGLDCGTPVDVCMTFDRGAERQVGRGRGEMLTLKETLDMIDSWRDFPLVHVHMGGVPKTVEEVQTFCNCHWDCCLAFTGYYTGISKHKISDFLLKTRFRATVDPEECIGCRTCIDERCQFGAIQMKYYPEFDEERSYTDEEKCMGCGLCVETCCVGARGMKTVEPPEYILGVDNEVEGIGGGGFAVENLVATVSRERAEREAKKEK
ncbi:ATP-binding protein [Chloroflexota bacterium]